MSRFTNAAGKVARTGTRVSEDQAAPGRRERGKEEKRARIKAAARALFAEKGFAATTTQEIAARADIGTGTLFLYAQSKEEILVLVIRDEMDRVCDEAFASLPRRRAFLDQLMHVYGSLIAFHDRDRGMARVFVKEVLFVKEKNRKAVYELVEGLICRTAMLADDGRQRGELDASVPTQLLAENCFAAYLLCLQRWLGMGEESASAEHVQWLRASLELQLRGLVPQPRASGGSGREAARRRRS